MALHSQSDPLGTLDTLENLAGFVDDLNNQTISRLSDPEALKTAVKQRFGPDVSVQDAMDAMDALRDLSTHA